MQPIKGDRPSAHRPRRDTEQGPARRERDARCLARRRPRRGGVGRHAALPLPGRRPRAEPARPVLQHSQRRQARGGSDRLPGVHGRARRGCVRGGGPRRLGGVLALRTLLHEDGHSIGQGDEGGFAPTLATNEAAIEYILRAIEKAGYRPGEDVAIGLDPAVSSILVEGTGDKDTPGRYRLETERRTLETDELIELWAMRARPLPDRVPGGRDRRGGLGRLAGAHQTGRRSRPPATTCS